MIGVSELNVFDRQASNRKLEDFWHLQRFFPKGVGVLKEKTRGGGGVIE